MDKRRHIVLLGIDGNVVGSVLVAQPLEFGAPFAKSVGHFFAVLLRRRVDPHGCLLLGVIKRDNA
jgi:hypothetical protein